MNELALFAGAGGSILGGSLLGWRTVCAVEIDAYCASVLVARQNDETMPAFPVWDDIRTFEGKRWRGVVDVISGGFPCQDISVTGKGGGVHGKKSGMWFEMVRIIREVRPRFIFVENSPALTVRGLGIVLGDLAANGYDARWLVLGAADLGAPHQRDRIWIAAKLNGTDEKRVGTYHGSFPCSNKKNRDEKSSSPFAIKEIPDTDGSRSSGPGSKEKKFAGFGDNRWWETEPALDRMADGMANRMVQVRALGNGQVPIVAATAWRELTAGWLQE